MIIYIWYRANMLSIRKTAIFIIEAYYISIIKENII